MDEERNKHFYLRNGNVLVPKAFMRIFARSSRSELLVGGGFNKEGSLITRIFLRDEDGLWPFIIMEGTGTKIDIWDTEDGAWPDFSAQRETIKKLRKDFQIWNRKEFYSKFRVLV